MGGDSLPEEIIIFDILTRLPVKSLCRFKCVSKSWLSTISSSKFVDCHFDRSRSHPRLLISVWTDGETRFGIRQNLFIADREDDTEQDDKGPLVLGHRVTLPVNEIQFVDSLTLAGLTRSISPQDLIVMTNPIIKASVAFPRAFQSQHFYRRSVSFGFDPVDSKHKIVESQLCTIGLTDLSLVGNMKIDHRVVSVSDSGNWRSVQGPAVHYLSEIEACVDGVIYSAATAMGEYLVAFSLRSEKFRVAKLSINGRVSFLPNPYRFVEFEGKLAIVDYPHSNKYGHYNVAVPALDLWIMEDFEKQVWSFKPFDLRPFFALTRVLIGSTSDGELIFALFGNKKKPFILPDDVHYVRTMDFGEDEVLSFSLEFLNMKTGNFRSREVHLPPGYPLTGKVRISAASLVERL